MGAARFFRRILSIVAARTIKIKIQVKLQVF
jgi:hypothetical protein